MRLCDRKALLDSGLGRIFEEKPSKPQIVISDPLVVIGIMQYLASKGKTTWSNVYPISHPDGLGFEAAVRLAMAKLSSQ
jgi:hypothetical protein